MKKTGILFVLLIIAFSVTACVGSMFSGSRTGNESQLIIDYTMLNKTDSQMLKLEEGDVVAIDVVSEEGTVNVVLQKDKEEPVFGWEDIPTTSCQVTIEESGTYKCSVTGKQAKGSVSVIKQ